jgi:hypothetical protein
MIGLPDRLCKVLRFASLSWLGGAMLLGAATLGAHPANASPLLHGAQASARLTAAPLPLQPIGACPDDGCATEITITPPPYPGDPQPYLGAPQPYPGGPGSDPIGREIDRWGPPAGNCGPYYPDPYAEADPPNCGIRCWYWRLRRGYCGPGCEYYAYRLHRDRHYFRKYRYACRS